MGQGRARGPHRVPDPGEGPDRGGRRAGAGRRRRRGASRYQRPGRSSPTSSWSRCRSRPSPSPCHPWPTPVPARSCATSSTPWSSTSWAQGRARGGGVRCRGVPGPDARRRVVSAFHDVSSRRLLRVDEPIDTHVLICGDDDEACHRVAHLANRIDGMWGVYCGPLRMSEYVENITPLILTINKLQDPGRAAHRRHRARAELAARPPRRRVGAKLTLGHPRLNGTVTPRRAPGPRGRGRPRAGAG